ncbi:hypothetical protein MMC11_007962 [Xylographa trunciseda]|nr:hypothetical protein [Xylographa trunciseda]
MAYPRTGRTELLTLAKFIAWYFPWDDAIDDASMMQQPDDIIRYKNETISVIQQSLGPDHRPQSEPHPNPAIQSFWDIGTEIRAKGTLETNQLLIDQQSAFITSAALSQIEREYSHPVTVEEYLKRRETNIAIYPLMALSYYAYNVAIPTELLPASNTHMRIIWTELARMGTMANDLLSMRREVMHGQFESLVPLMMYHNDLGVQAAVDRGTEMIHESYHRFDQAEQELYHEVSSENLGTVKAYLAACKDLIMCNLHWR